MYSVCSWSYIAGADKTQLDLNPRQSIDFPLEGGKQYDGLQNSVVITSDLAPGLLGSKLVSRSDGNLFEAEMMTKDASDQSNGGEHPWSTLEDDQSSLLLFNHDAASRDIHVHIFGQTSRWEKVYKLSAGETMQININAIIADQVKDQRGKTLDRGERQSIVVWFASDPRYVKGRLLIGNRSHNMARNFSCATTIVICGGYVSVYGVQSHDMLYTLSRDILYTSAPA